MPKTGKLARTFQKARTLIESGWTRNTMKRECKGNVCYCTMGALREVVGPTAFYAGNTQNILRELFSKANPEISWFHFGRIEDWNDAPRRRKPQVLKAFDKAIALAQQRGI